jgi:hypothetical protein
LAHPKIIPWRPLCIWHKMVNLCYCRPYKYMSKIKIRCSLYTKMHKFASKMRQKRWRPGLRPGLRELTTLPRPPSRRLGACGPSQSRPGLGTFGASARPGFLPHKSGNPSCGASIYEKYVVQGPIEQTLVARILDHFWSMLVQSWTNIIILVQYYTNIGQLFFAARDIVVTVK